MSASDAVVTSIGLVLLAAVLTSPVACTMRRHVVVAQVIKDGADPIAAKCAIEAGADQSPMCVARAMRP